MSWTFSGAIYKLQEFLYFALLIRKSYRALHLPNSSKSISPYVISWISFILLRSISNSLDSLFSWFPFYFSFKLFIGSTLLLAQFISGDIIYASQLKSIFKRYQITLDFILHASLFVINVFSIIGELFLSTFESIQLSLPILRHMPFFPDYIFPWWRNTQNDNSLHIHQIWGIQQETGNHKQVNQDKPSSISPYRNINSFQHIKSQSFTPHQTPIQKIKSSQITSCPFSLQRIDYASSQESFIEQINLTSSSPHQSPLDQINLTPSTTSQISLDRIELGILTHNQSSFEIKSEMNDDLNSTQNISHNTRRKSLRQPKPTLFSDSNTSNKNTKKPNSLPKSLNTDSKISKTSKKIIKKNSLQKSTKITRSQNTFKPKVIQDDLPTIDKIEKPSTKRKRVTIKQTVSVSKPIPTPNITPKSSLSARPTTRLSTRKAKAKTQTISYVHVNVSPKVDISTLDPPSKRQKKTIT